MGRSLTRAALPHNLNLETPQVASLQIIKDRSVRQEQQSCNHAVHTVWRAEPRG